MLIYGEFSGEPAQLCDAGQSKSPDQLVTHSRNDSFFS